MEVVATIGLSMMAVGQVSQGYQQKQELNFQASLADREAENTRRAADVERAQAELTGIEAKQELEKGRTAIEQHRKKSDAIMGEFIAKTAARGVKLSGSPLEYLGETAADLGFEREQIRYESEVNAWNKSREGAIRLDRAKLLDAEASMYNTQGRVYRKQGKQAATSGWIKGLGTAAIGGYGIYGKPWTGAASGIAAGAEDSTSAALSGGWK